MQNNVDSANTRPKNIKAGNDPGLENIQTPPPGTPQSDHYEQVDNTQLFYSETYPNDLPLFGQNLFKKTVTANEKNIVTTVPGDYVLGPGDAFRLLFTGKELKEVEVVIDGEGMILVPDIGLVPAAGLRFNEFKTMLASRTKQKLIGFELSHVSISTLRSIRVFLLGSVKNPGTHHTSSLTSLMQFLLETGGILPVGSLRNVQVKRSGSPDKNIDLYTVLIGGKSDGDLRLQDGDTIFVPTIGNTVALTGTVKKPAVYEISKENNVDEITQLAGGLLPNAQMIKIERIDKNKNRTILDLDLKNQGHLQTQVKSGDIIHVLPASDSRKETITLMGFVERGGVFQWTRGMKLRDIIHDPSMLLPQTDLSHLLVVRTNPKNRQLEPLSVNLGRALLDPSSSDNIPLQPNDQIQLFGLGADHSKNVQTVVEKLRNQGRYNNIDKLVTIVGNVRFPGEYPFAHNMDLRQLITAAGDIHSNTDMDYCLIVRSDQTGRIQPFSVRLRDILGLEGTEKIIALKPKDQVLVFSLDEKNTDKLNPFSKKSRNKQHKAKDRSILFDETYDAKTKDNSDESESFDPWSIDSIKDSDQRSSGTRGDPSKNRNHDQNPDQDNEQDQVDNEILNKDNKRNKSYPRSTDLDSDSEAKDIALENQEMENVLVGFLLKNGSPEAIEGKNQEAYRNQLVDPVLYENQNRLLQLLKKKRELRQTVKDELRPEKERPVKPRQILLQPVLEKLQEQATKESPAQIIQIGGAVRYAGRYPLESGMRIRDLLLAGGGLSEPAYHLEAEISHFKVDADQTTKMHHSKLNLFNIMQGDPSADQPLQPYDIVIIKQNPKWADINAVVIEGNVRFPGVYPIQPGEKMTQVLERAGGLSELAYPEAAVFTRKKLLEKERRENENLISRMETHLIQTQFNKQLMKENQASAADSGMILELIAKLKTTKPIGRLAINLGEIVKHPGGPHDLLLQDGDHLIIPQRNDEVTVMGEVYFPTSHQFLTEQDLESYIQASGGYSRSADDERVYVVRADGRVSSVSQNKGFPGVGWFSSGSSMNIGPGDTIVVPMDVERMAPMAFWKDVSQILYNLAITTTALRAAGGL